ncbi:MAG: hemerythrin domain-containing protein [Gallionella sp.]|jgi:hemerythrin-like domain-containing protein
MKRSAILQPLSREHHTALTLAKASEHAAQSGDEILVSQVCQRVIRAYANELELHFQFEEVSLLPLLHSTETQPLVERALADHQQLRGLINALRQNDAEALDNFGKCLSAHVRFEERELFPVLENLL